MVARLKYIDFKHKMSFLMVARLHGAGLKYIDFKYKMSLFVLIIIIISVFLILVYLLKYHTLTHIIYVENLHFILQNKV